MRNAPLLLLAAIILAVLALPLLSPPRDRGTVTDAGTAASGKDNSGQMPPKPDGKAAVTGDRRQAEPGADTGDAGRSRLRFMLSRDESLTSPIRLSDGRVGVALNGTHMSVSAARRRPDGTIEVSCFDSADGLESFLDGARAGRETVAATEVR